MKKKYKKVLSIVLLCFFIFPNSAFALSLDATMNPSNINLSIKAGESSTFDLVTTTGTPPIKKLDVVFLIDRTGSMRAVIDQVKQTAINIMTNVKGKVPDSQFGVMAFQDYPGPLNCSGYSGTYGNATDKPFELKQTVTDDANAVTTALNSITAAGGNDVPESYTRVLYEAGIGTPKWRTDSKKVIILLGDAPTHDLNLGGINTGGDPGPDGKFNTADDLHFDKVVQDLADKKMTVLAIQSGTDDTAVPTFKGASVGYGTVAGTTGQYYSLQGTDTTQITTEIMKMVTLEVSNVKELSLKVPDQYKSWFKSDPNSFTNVGAGASNNFKVTVTVPAGTPAGDYNFPVNLMGDGAVLSTSNVKVSVTPETSTGSGSFEIASKDYGVIEDKGSVSVTINRTGGSFGEVAVDYSTSNGKAIAGEDYIETKGTAIFKDGEISKTISIPIIDDGIYDPDEDFNFNISNPAGGATLGINTSAKITITDNEIRKPGTLEFSSFDYTINNTAGKVQITVNRTNGSDGTVSADYRTSDGTAMAGTDYTAVSGTVTFNEGEVTKSFEVPLNKDLVYSTTKNFNVILENAQNGAMLGAKNTTVVKINSTSAPVQNEIVVDPSSVTLKPGQTSQLHVYANMSDGTKVDKTQSSQGTTYATSDSSIATVDANGLVTVLSTAKDGAKATITATNSGKTSSSVINVVDDAVKVSSISIDPTSAELLPGEQKQIKVTAAMSDGSSKDITNDGVVYSTSDSAIATVDTSGNIKVLDTAKIGASVTITVNYNGMIKSCNITIKDNTPTMIDFSINPSSIQLAPTEQKKLEIIGKMSDGTTKVLTEGVTFTTSDAKVATVDNIGTVAATESSLPGLTATISATINGVTKTCLVTIKSAPTITSISLNTTSATMAPLEEKQLQVTAAMSDGTTKVLTSGVTYTTSDVSIATVDANGLVKVTSTALNGFTATITAKYGAMSKTFVVTVQNNTPVVSSISLNYTSATMSPLEEKQLEVTAKMSDGTSKVLTSGVTYTTSDLTVATVDANGLVKVTETALNGYSATITAKYGAMTKTFVVTVQNNAPVVSSISLNYTSATMAPLEEKQLQVTAAMSDGTTKVLTSGVTYTTSDVSVATVDANGLVKVASTALNGFTATITARYGAMTKTFVVTVQNNAPVISSISLNYTSATMAPLEEKQLEVTAKMSDGTSKVLTSGVTYTTSDATVSTVDANGLVKVTETALNGYTATITAKYGAMTKTFVVTVQNNAPVVSSISLNATSATMAPLEEKQLQVTAAMSDGTSKVLTSGVTYTTSDATVATVDANGLVKVAASALNGFTATITAKYGAMTKTFVVTVQNNAPVVSSILLNYTSATMAPLEEKQLEVTAKMSDGTTKVLTSGVTYTTSDATVATVDANGLVKVTETALNGYSATITAKYGAMTKTFVVTVQSTVVSSISLNATSATMAPLEEKQLEVTAKMSDGTTKVLTSGVTYTTSDATVATVDANGLVKVASTALNGYTATITAKYGAMTKTFIVTVQNNTPVVSSISLNYTSATMAPLEEKQLQVTARMSDGTSNVLTSGVTYTTSDATVATVDANGLVKVAETALNGYSATITAKYGAMTKTFAVTVQGIVVSSISLNATSATMAPLEEKQLQVTAAMSDGTTKVLTSGVTYTTSDSTVATVDANGLVKVTETALNGYTATITAKYGAMTKTFMVTVQNNTPVVSSISLNYASAIMAPLEEKQLEVTAKMSDGTTNVLTSGVTYTTSDATVATVDANGLVKVAASALNGYTATITAKYGAMTRAFAVTVQNNTPVVSSISLNYASATMAPLEEKQLEVTAKMSDGTTKVLTSGVTYTTSDATVATVDANGLVKVAASALNGYTATITVKYGAMTRAFAVTVQNNTPVVSSISLNYASATMAPLEEKQLEVTAKMSDGTTKVLTSGVTYTTSDATVATVDANGLVKIAASALNGFTATITVRYGAMTRAFAVTVQNSTPVVSSISLNYASATMSPLEEKQLEVTAKMSDGTTKVLTSGVTYTTSDATVATVDANGLVKVAASALNGFTATITVRYGAMTRAFVVTVQNSTPVVSSISLNYTSATMSPLEEKQLQVTAKMSDGTTKVLTSGVTYTTSDATVATVDANGLVKVAASALNGFTATITARYGAMTKTFLVTVQNSTPVVSSISLNYLSATMSPLEEKQLQVTAKMSDGTSKVLTSGVTYTTSDATVATVDANGLVKVTSTALNGFTATITARYGAMTKTFVVTVQNSAPVVSSITLNYTSATMSPLEEKQLQVTAAMSDGTTKVLTSGVTYTTSDATVATVDANGLVKVASTALNGFTATITARYGAMTKTFLVTVQNSAPVVSSITLNYTSATMTPLEEKQLQVTAKMSDGTSKVLTSGVTYTTSDATVATVDANGLVKVTSTALRGFTATITVRYGAMTKTFLITVTIP